MAVGQWRLKDRYYRLLGNKCQKCGKEFFPPVFKCRNCGSDKLKDADMAKSGVLQTYTILRETLPGFEDQEPMVFGIVKLDNGPKVLGQIVDLPPELITIGSRLKVVFRKIKTEGEHGQIFYGYKFTRHNHHNSDNSSNGEIDSKKR